MPTRRRLDKRRYDLSRTLDKRRLRLGLPFPFFKMFRRVFHNLPIVANKVVAR